jgi:hypothetical protein
VETFTGVLLAEQLQRVESKPGVKTGDGGHNSCDMLGTLAIGYAAIGALVQWRSNSQADALKTFFKVPAFLSGPLRFRALSAAAWPAVVFYLVKNAIKS